MLVSSGWVSTWYFSKYFWVIDYLIGFAKTTWSFSFSSNDEAKPKGVDT